MNKDVLTGGYSLFSLVSLWIPLCTVTAWVTELERCPDKLSGKLPDNKTIYLSLLTVFDLRRALSYLLLDLETSKANTLYGLWPVWNKARRPCPPHLSGSWAHNSCGGTTCHTQNKMKQIFGIWLGTTLVTHPGRQRPHWASRVGEHAALPRRLSRLHWVHRLQGATPVSPLNFPFSQGMQTPWPPSPKPQSWEWRRV